MNKKIGVVIVTYNRIEKLKKALECFERQISLPSYILVVDNASTDGTAQYLDMWGSTASVCEKIVIRNKENLGGSGGFYTGLERAFSLEADWIWVSDDDAFPEEDALKEAYSYLTEHEAELEGISAICGAVINDGKIDIAHRKNMYSRGVKVIEQLIPEEDYLKPEFELNAFSYVGTIISKAKMAEVGFTQKEYFIWWDDTEHSLRLAKAGRIICVPAIRIEHNVPGGNGKFGWKNYYGYRNAADLYKRHFTKMCYHYFRWRVILITCLLDLVGKRRSGNKAVRCAMRDVRDGKLGIHPIYKPGWKPED